MAIPSIEEHSGRIFLFFVSSGRVTFLTRPSLRLYISREEVYYVTRERSTTALCSVRPSVRLLSRASNEYSNNSKFEYDFDTPCILEFEYETNEYE